MGRGRRGEGIRFFLFIFRFCYGRVVRGFLRSGSKFNLRGVYIVYFWKEKRGREFS